MTDIHQLSATACSIPLPVDISFIIHATIKGVAKAPITLLTSEFKIAVAVLPPAGYV